jgi:hypothetical protein
MNDEMQRYCNVDYSLKKEYFLKQTSSYFADALMLLRQVSFIIHEIYLLYRVRRNFPLRQFAGFESNTKTI